MTTYLGKSCSFGLPRLPFVNCRQFMYLFISLLVLRAESGIWLYQFLIIAYLFTLSAPAPGLYTCVKHYKMCIKSEFREICLKLATSGRIDKNFLLTSKVCPQGVFYPCPGAIYMYKSLKMCIKSDFEEIIFKLATYGQREKAFLLS